MKKNSSIIIILILLVAGIILGLFLFGVYQDYEREHFVSDNSTGDYEKRNIVVGGKTILVEVADTNEKRVRGLSGHYALADGEGMLFVFERSDKYSFWMKEMLFPIDIIWIGEDFTIVDITENAEPSSYPNLFTPRNDVQYVLEVRDGFANQKELKIGDMVEIL